MLWVTALVIVSAVFLRLEVFLDYLFKDCAGININPYLNQGRWSFNIAVVGLGQ